MTLDATVLVHEGVAALRAFWVESYLHYDFIALSVLIVHLVVRVGEAVLLEGLDGRCQSCQSILRREDLGMTSWFVS